MSEPDSYAQTSIYLVHQAISDNGRPGEGCLDAKVTASRSIANGAHCIW